MIKAAIPMWQAKVSIEIQNCGCCYFFLPVLHVQPSVSHYVFIAAGFQGYTPLTAPKKKRNMVLSDTCEPENETNHYPYNIWTEKVLADKPKRLQPIRQHQLYLLTRREKSNTWRRRSQDTIWWLPWVLWYADKVHYTRQIQFEPIFWTVRSKSFFFFYFLNLAIAVLT